MQAAGLRNGLSHCGWRIWPARFAARASNAGDKAFWALIESNAQLFNPRKLVSILVPAANLAPADREDPRLVRLLQRAVKYLEGDGLVVPVIGAKGSAAIAKAAYQLRTNEARRFVLAFTGVMAAQVPKLEPPVLAELSQELQRFQVGDQQLWEALVQDTARRPQELKPLDIVYLLDAFRRALSFGVRPAPALEATCQRIMECYQDFNSKQCTGALGSVCRLSGHIDSSQQYKVMHLLLGQWLASQPAKWETTPSNQVISVAVSLSGLGVLSDRTETFLAAASSWALRWGAPEGGALSAEDLVVLLWSLKEMTPLGLARYRELVQLSLVRIRAAATYEDWTLVRQGQALEVLLSAKHALVEDGADLAVAEELLLGIEAPMTAALSKQLAQAPCSFLAKVLATGEQGGTDFWLRCSGLTEAVLQRASGLASNAAVSPEELQPVLDTIAASHIARTAAFRSSCDALCAVVGQRQDADHPVLAAAVRSLDKAMPQPEAKPVTKAAEAPASSPGPGFESERPLSPMELAERLGKLGKAKVKSSAELSVVADRFLAVLESLDPNELLPALNYVLRSGRKRLAREPLLLEVVERIGDQVALYAKDLSVLQLLSALDSFASLGLPYHLLFESVLVELLQRKQLSWQQAIAVMESFAAVRLRIPELSQIYGRLRRQQELARLPTMGMVRFLYAATRLDLTDQAGLDVREMISRILAETSPYRALPLEDTVAIIQSLLLSGTVPPDMQLRHLLSWTADMRPRQLSEESLTVLRHYSFFILAQADAKARGSLQRMPVEIQTQISELLCHRSPCWTNPITDLTRTMRSEVSELLESVPGVEHGVSLGPAGLAELEVDGTLWLLDGPEAFFRPFAELRYTPQERQRHWLLERLLSSDVARRSIADFYPPALDWPKKRGPMRLNWQQWSQAGPEARRRLLGLGEEHVVQPGLRAGSLRVP